MRTILCLLVGIILSAATFVSAQKPGDDAQEIERMIEKYGESASEPINNGFFFADGQYVPAPYIVERKGRAIYINGHQLEYGYDRTYKDWRILQDPGPPPGLPWDETDPSAKSYWNKKWRYLNTVHKRDDVKSALAATLRMVDGVKSVDYSKSHAYSLVLIGNSGKEYLVQFGSVTVFRSSKREESTYAFPNLHPITTKQDLIDSDEETRKFYADTLTSNDALFNVLDGAGQQYWGSGISIPAMAVLLSDLSKEDKKKELEKLGITLYGDWIGRTLDVRIDDREELRARLERIKEEQEKKDAERKGK